MTLQDILENRNEYQIIVSDSMDDNIKKVISIDEFEMIFNNDHQMFCDYLRLLSSKKFYTRESEIWYIIKKE